MFHGYKKQLERFKPNLNSMEGLLKQSGISLPKDSLLKLWAYHQFLRQKNTDQDLTRLVGFESIVIKHYVDCMIVGDYFKIPSPLLDIGTGAGLPGIPLKIRYPHLKLILAEPRPRRIEFLKGAISLLGLKDVSVFEHKVVSRSFHEKVSAVVTRALEPIEKTMLRTSACLDRGGMLIFLKGPGVEPELKAASRRFKDDFVLVKDEHYFLPKTQFERRLIVWEKRIPATSTF